jgi:hypothetical protein
MAQQLTTKTVLALVAESFTSTSPQLLQKLADQVKQSNLTTDLNLAAKREKLLKSIYNSIQPKQDLTKEKPTLPRGPGR